LTGELEMTRFGMMKHLKVLEEAGLVVTLRQGREKHPDRRHGLLAHELTRRPGGRLGTWTLPSRPRRMLAGNSAAGLRG
jgi:DNA-binding transcriptional ArsR family regulator